MRPLTYLIAPLLALALNLPLAQPPAPPAPSSQPPAPVTATAPENLLPNASFERGAYDPAAAPEGWAHDSFRPDAVFTWDAATALHGKRSVRIDNPAPNDSRWTVTVPVEPHTFYGLSAWLKTEDVQNSGYDSAGANICLMNTWQHTAGLYGTNEWTYRYMLFNSGEQTEVTIGARLGFWGETITGRAWFDGLRLTPIRPVAPRPGWRIQVLIYPTTDFSYIDRTGVGRHVHAQMTADERNRAEQQARLFVTQDIPALDSGLMTPSVTVRTIEHPLTRLSSYGDGWSPFPNDTADDRDPAFDSTLVIWDPRATDLQTHESIWIGAAAGLAHDMGTAQTYAAIIIEATNYGHRNVFKHEWGHSILSFYANMGASPDPPVTNHATAGQYVHCPSGAPYVWEDETDAHPIPNSIYSNAGGFTHDYYSGSTALAGQPGSCLGITPYAWSLGGAVSNSAYYPFYHQLALAAASTTQTTPAGQQARYSLTISNTGNVTDSFTLTTKGQSWPVTVPGRIEDVGAGRSARFEVAVAVPAAGGVSDTLTLTATSARQPDETAALTLTTVVRAAPPRHVLLFPYARR